MGSDLRPSSVRNSRVCWWAFYRKGFKLTRLCGLVRMTPMSQEFASPSLWRSALIASLLFLFAAWRQQRASLLAIAVVLCLGGMWLRPAGEKLIQTWRDPNGKKIVPPLIWLGLSVMAFIVVRDAYGEELGFTACIVVMISLAFVRLAD